MIVNHEILLELQFQLAAAKASVKNILNLNSELEFQLGFAKAENQKLSLDIQTARISRDEHESENNCLHEALERILQINKLGDLPQGTHYYQAAWENCRAIAQSALDGGK